MPRIRKKTSKRGTTNDRRKVHNKVKESRKKKSKAAKNNVQWKSKHKKDPGVPTNFPYKDQILAEIQDQRRIAAEAKERRKEEKRLQRSGADSEPAEGGSQTVIVEGLPKPQDVGLEGIASISARNLVDAKLRTRESSTKRMEVDSDSESEDGAPALLNPTYPHLKAVIDSADVVIEVLDGRDPESFRSSRLEEYVLSKPGRKLLFVLNKIDMCPREALSAWTKAIRSQHPAILFRSATTFLPPKESVTSRPAKGKGKAKAVGDDARGVDSVMSCLSLWAKGSSPDKPLTVAVVGMTNVGKSSFVNSMLRKRLMPVYSLATSSRGPTTSLRPQETSISTDDGVKINIVDTPGVMWRLDDSSKEDRPRDILLRNKGRIDRLKDPIPPVTHIVSRATTEDLMLLYNLPAFMERDSDAFLSGVARSAQLVKKKGSLDTAGAARLVLRDWNRAKMSWYSSPPPSTTDQNASDEDALSSIYNLNNKLLEDIPTKKERRKAGGLVQLQTGSIDDRQPVFEEPWEVVSDDESDNQHPGDIEEEESGDELDGMEDEEVFSDDDESEVEDGDETEDDVQDIPSAPLGPLSKKERRKRAADEDFVTPAKKKVAFALKPKGSKKSRSAASVNGKPASTSVSVKQKTTSTVLPKPTKSSAGAVGGQAGQDEAYDFGSFF